MSKDPSIRLRALVILLLPDLVEFVKYSVINLWSIPRDKFVSRGQSNKAKNRFIKQKPFA